MQHSVTLCNLRVGKICNSRKPLSPRRMSLQLESSRHGSSWDTKLELNFGCCYPSILGYNREGVSTPDNVRQAAERFSSRLLEERVDFLPHIAVFKKVPVFAKSLEYRTRLSPPPDGRVLPCRRHLTADIDLGTHPGSLPPCQ